MILATTYNRYSCTSLNSYLRHVVNNIENKRMVNVISIINDARCISLPNSLRPTLIYSILDWSAHYLTIESSFVTHQGMELGKGISV